MAAPQVLIVGSGPAGLVLALALVKNGIAVRIIEKNTGHFVGERGCGVVPRTLEIEHFLGVYEDVRSAGLGPPYLTIFNSKDPYRAVKSFDTLQKFSPTPAFPITDGVTIGQWLHQEILRKHLEKLGCRVELGCTLQGVEQQDDGVLAHLTKEKDGSQLMETTRFAYVVGADGARSTVRKSLNINFVGESRSNRMYFVDARVEGLPAEGRDIFKWEDRGRNVVTLRYTNQPGVFWISLAGEDVDVDALDKASVEVIQSTFNKLSGRTDLKVTEILSRGEWRPNIRIADRFSNGRVFIAGDAAHVHAPTGGQGLNSSVQDSFNLAWKLVLSLKSHASSTLLNSYESERLPVIAEMLNITTELFNKLSSRLETQRGVEAAHSQAQAYVEGKDKGDGFYTRDWKLFQLDVNYRWSEIVLDERFTEDEDNADIKKRAYGTAGHDIRAGDRAPDAPGLTVVRENASEDSTTRLFDVFSPTAHTVLVFSSNLSGESFSNLLAPFTRIPKEFVQSALILPPDVSKSKNGLASSNIDRVFCDSEGHAYKGYGLKSGEEEAMAVIVRPDAMIGAFVKSAEGAEKYLSLVFS